MSRLKSRAKEPRGQLSSGALIELVYRAISAPDLWQQLFTAVGELVDSRGTTLVLRGPGPVRAVGCDGDGPAIGLVTMTPVQLFSNKALSRKSFVMAVVDGHTIDDWAHLPSDNSVPSLSLFTRQGSASLAAQGMLRSVLPHAHRALVLALSIHDLGHERDDLRQVVDELSCGIVLLDTNLMLRYCNEVASDYLGLGLGLQVTSGALSATEPADDEALRALARELAASPSGPLRALRLSNGVSLFLRSVPGERLLLYLRPGGQQPNIPPPLLAEVFGLSHAESRVGSLFAAGHSTETIATELGVSPETVRAHLDDMRERAAVDADLSLLRRFLDGVPRVAKY